MGVSYIAISQYVEMNEPHPTKTCACAHTENAHVKYKC